jgi:hypothetical protein
MKETISKKKLLISFSGGRTSAYMTWWLLNNMQDKYEMKVVFANTGKEREETLEFVRKCDEYFGFNVVWVEAFVNHQSRKGTTHTVTNFESAKRSGEPFEAIIEKYGIPNQAYPHCSRELKMQPIKSYARSIGWAKCYTAIGIRHDETNRLDFEKAKKQRLIYPLATINRVFTSDINLFWSKQPFDLELKSYEGNCDLCWKKSERKLLTMLAENPEMANWWIQMEQKYSFFIPDSRSHRKDVKPPFLFYRKNKSIAIFLEKSKNQFEAAIDTSKDYDIFKQIEMFDVNLDEHGSCSESCEAF